MPNAEPSTDLDDQAIRAHLETSVLGCRLVVLARTASTMDDAAALASSRAPEGTTVVADHQSAGRGRLGRSWLAPGGSAVLLSVLLRPPARRMLLWDPMAIALGALDALSALAAADLGLGLKWPNDIVIGDAKLGGMVAESAWTEGRPATLIVGLGVNVTRAAGRGVPGATSLEAAIGRVPDRSCLIGAILTHADRRLRRSRAGHSPVADWQARLTTIGRRVRVTQGGSIVAGLATGVTADGALTVREETGRIWTFRAADVTLADLIR